jgi:hypothetical protein
MANEIPDDILDDVFRSNATAGGSYLDRYGSYDLLIEQAQYKQVKDVGRLFITKLKVMRSAPLSANEPADKSGPARIVNEEPHPVGYRASYVVNWDGDAKLSADGNAKALVLGIFGLNEATVTGDVFKQTFKEMVGAGQPARGMMVHAEVKPKGVGKADGIFSHSIKLPYWECLGVPGQGHNTMEQIAARRAEIEQYIGSENERDAQRENEREKRLSSAAAGGGAPILPSLPGAPPLPAAGDPLAGWTLHPNNVPNDPDPFYWKGNESKRKSQLLAGK